MKAVKLIATCLASTIFFSSCNELKGVIIVNAPINVVKDKKTYVIPVGSHKANLKVKKENLINFEVQTLSGEKDIKITTNFNAKNLYDGQHINVPSHVSGQPFDIIGLYKDKTRQSGHFNGWESCTYTVQERVCRDVYYPPVCRTITECNPYNPKQCHTRQICEGGGYRYVCDYVNVTRYGQQDVAYYNSYRERSLNLEAVVAGQRHGRIFAENKTSDKVYTYKGFCR